MDYRIGLVQLPQSRLLTVDASVRAPDFGTRFGTHAPATRSCERDRRLFTASSKWSVRGSNPWPPTCKYQVSSRG